MDKAVIEQVHLEQGILGIMLNENHLIGECGVKAEHFAVETHRKLYKAFLELKNTNSPVDVITLLTSFEPSSIGGANYINEIAQISDIKKFDSYTEMLFKKYQERTKNELLKLAVSENWSIERITSELQAIESNKTSDRHNSRDLVVELYETPYKPLKEKMSVSTGLSSLDQVTDGFKKGEVTIVAARSSTGKTDLMLQFVKGTSKDGGLPIIFSLEMPAESLTKRLLASTANYNRYKLQNPYERMTEADKKKWNFATAEVGNMNYEVFDSGYQSIADIKRKVRKVVRENPGCNPVVFIDYLQLIAWSNKNSTAYSQVTEISRELHLMAEEFDIPVVCLSQLNREVEKRQDKRPMMSDLRESGAIEQDANVILMLYRDSYYTKDKNDKSLEIIVAKNREGETGTVTVYFNTHTGVIKDAKA